LPDKPSIVVLPFVNMSEDPKQEYFSNGITEVLTSDLSPISSLFVIARNTAFTYKGKAVNVHDIQKELGVRYVLEGGVQKAGEQVRIVTQLVDTTTDAHVWSERYLSHYPNILHIHLMLAAVCSELGQATEARAEAAEVLRLNRNFSLEVHKQRAPIKDPAVLERHLAALRKAGLK